MDPILIRCPASNSRQCMDSVLSSVAESIREIALPKTELNKYMDDGLIYRGTRVGRAGARIQGEISQIKELHATGDYFEANDQYGFNRDYANNIVSVLKLKDKANKPPVIVRAKDIPEQEMRNAKDRLELSLKKTNSSKTLTERDIFLELGIDAIVADASEDRSTVLFKHFVIYNQEVFEFLSIVDSLKIAQAKYALKRKNVPNEIVNSNMKLINFFLGYSLNFYRLSKSEQKELTSPEQLDPIIFNLFKDGILKIEK